MILELKCFWYRQQRLGEQLKLLEGMDRSRLDSLRTHLLSMELDFFLLWFRDIVINTNFYCHKKHVADALSTCYIRVFHQHFIVI